MMMHLVIKYRMEIWCTAKIACLSYFPKIWGENLWKNGKLVRIQGFEDRVPGH
jgi:hypothetical protein